MQNAHVSGSSTTPALLPAPFATSQVILTKQEHIQLKQQANLWHAMWKAACGREQKVLAKNASLIAQHKVEIAGLNTQVADLKSELAHMKHLLFGRKSEKTCSSSKKSGNTTRPPSNRKRGHQPGVPGSGRHLHNNLPVVHESVDLPVDKQCCTVCHRPFKSFFNDDSCDVIEVEVKAHVRRYHRRLYQKTCQCPETPNITTPPPPPRLINRGKLGISVWVELLLNKYAYGIPINRQLESYKTQGLELSQATISFGLEAITPFFEPVAEATREFVASSDQWHADETRWITWAHETTGSHKHWLWVFLCDQAVYFSIADSRAAVVPESVIGDGAGTLVCDRYSAYKKLANDVVSIDLAFCWAHVRRDFIDAQRGDPELEKWSATWVNRIGRLYHLNSQRLEMLDEPEQLATQQLRLEHQVEQIATQRDQELNRPKLRVRAKKVLESLQNHWEGLTRFVTNPGIPMDNNAAEQALRTGVVGRKNYYGSGSVWSADIAAFLFSVFMTLKLWDINPKIWLGAYLEACAINGRKPPDELTPYLPWLMSEERLCEMRNHDPPKV